MKMKLLIAGSLTVGAMVSGQTPVHQEVRKEVRVIMNGSPVAATAGAPITDTLSFIANQFRFDGKPVADAPYSAESVTESVQLLADGNRISNKTTSQVYRDGLGRTRREEPLPLPGSLAKKTIFINDPVAHVSYVLDPDKKTARKISVTGNSAFVMYRPNTSSASQTKSINQTITMHSTNDEVVFEKRVKSPNGEETVMRKAGEEAKAEANKLHGSAEAVQIRGAHSMEAGHAITISGATSLSESKNAKVDQLGKKVIEGVECTGTRTTVTLAAGTIGNERPIDTVSETWTSTELQTAMQTRRSDPRTGETSFKLTNVRRTEPLHSLFEVPADYKIEEGGGLPGNVMYFNHKADGPVH